MLEGVGGGRLGGWVVGSAGSGCVSISRRAFSQYGRSFVAFIYRKDRDEKIDF